MKSVVFSCILRDVFRVGSEVGLRFDGFDAWRWLSVLNFGLLECSFVREPSYGRAGFSGLPG